MSEQVLRFPNVKSFIKKHTSLRVPKDVVNYLIDQVEDYLDEIVGGIDEYSEGIGAKTLVVQDAGLSVSDLKRFCSECSTLRVSSEALYRIKALGEEEVIRRVKTATAKAEEMKETSLGLRHFRMTERAADQMIERGAFLDTNTISKHIERNIYSRGVSLEAAEIALSEVESRIEYALIHLASWNAPEEYDERYEELYDIVSSVGQVGIQSYLATLIKRAGERANGDVIQSVHMMDAASELRIEATYG